VILSPPVLARLSILALAFLIGSIPFGLLIVKIFYSADIRESGSGNIGATNVSRVIGFWPAGFATFVLDFAKGILPVLMIRVEGLRGVWSQLFAIDTDTFFSPLLLWATGFAVVAGHCYSPWLHFKGGKGVATGLGVLAVLSPISAFFGAVGFVIFFLVKKVGSVASLAGLAFASITCLVVEPVSSYLWMGAAMIFLIVVRHESNINALLENREASFR
jgi:glycerol-3-phosphate acyltransferase PlsY